MQIDQIHIADYDYPLPEERVAKFPLPERDSSKLLVYRDGLITEKVFKELPGLLPAASTLVFNETKVVRARLVFSRESGARIEIFCLEPLDPPLHEMALSARGCTVWKCMVGNSRKWKRDEVLSMEFNFEGQQCELTARRGAMSADGSDGVVFEWTGQATFGQLLEALGRMPIPPYLNRESDKSDLERYQTVYSRLEGSVAAPTAGLHFNERMLAELDSDGLRIAKVALHVGAGTFLPVKTECANDHRMHGEHLSVSREQLRAIVDGYGKIMAVGTTAVRTLESLAVLGLRVLRDGHPDPARTVGQWEAYEPYPGTPVRECTDGRDYPDEPGAKIAQADLSGMSVWEGRNENEDKNHPAWSVTTLAQGDPCVLYVSDGITSQPATSGENGLSGVNRRGKLTGTGDPANTAGSDGSAGAGIPGGMECLCALLGYMDANGVEVLRGSTRMMIVPGYRFRVVDMLLTNFHQPCSTLLLLVSAFVGGCWKEIYDHALANGFRFLSYGDSSLLFRNKD